MYLKRRKEVIFDCTITFEYDACLEQQPCTLKISSTNVKSDELRYNYTAPLVTFVVCTCMSTVQADLRQICLEI